MRHPPGAMPKTVGRHGSAPKEPQSPAATLLLHLHVSIDSGRPARTILRFSVALTPTSIRHTLAGPFVRTTDAAFPLTGRRSRRMNKTGVPLCDLQVQYDL